MIINTAAPCHCPRDIVNLAMDLVYMHGARCVMISDLARFPMHRTDWCIRVNRHLRQLVAELLVNTIHLRRQEMRTLQLTEHHYQQGQCARQPASQAGVL